MNSNDPAALPSTFVGSAWLFRLAYRILPYVGMYYPFLKQWEAEAGLLGVPWGKFHLFFPAAWLKAAGPHIYKTPESINPEFFALLAPVLRTLKSGAIVDVGAHMGVYLLNYRSCSSAPIIAFEPEPYVFSLLTHNARANQLDSVDLRNVACGEETATVSLDAGINSSIARPARGQSPSKASVSVPLVRLDDQLGSANSIAFLKIDCEGFEYHVLAGAREVLRKHRPAVFIELHPAFIGNYGHTLSEVCDLLRGDYDLEFWDCDRHERSTNPLARFLGRYTNGCVRFADEAEMLASVRIQPKIMQVFLLGRPKQR